MYLLINENFPGDAVAALRQLGHDVAWIREDSPGIPDNQVLEQAQGENRILITLDKDFGELAFRFGLPAACGIILFRISMPSAEYVARLAVAAIQQREDWAVALSPTPGVESRYKQGALAALPGAAVDFLQGIDQFPSSGPHLRQLLQVGAQHLPFLLPILNRARCGPLPAQDAGFDFDATGAAEQASQPAPDLRVGALAAQRLGLPLP